MTWITRYDHHGVHALELLVVWRGQPGWFLRGPSGSSGGGSGSSVHSITRYGDVELRLDLETAARTAEIQGKRVDLGDRNVVLVDNVDSADAVRVAAVLRVDPEVALLNGRYPDIDAILMRSPELVSFLQCDVQMPGNRGPAFISRTCAPGAR